MDSSSAWFRSATLRRTLGWANLIANIVIVVTGGAVRLTASGLGCPEWPKCTPDSFTTTEAMGIHGLIEYGNRTLTGVVGVLAVAALVAAWLARPRSRGQAGWGLGLVLGVVAQALLGGLTVHSALNPWVVGAHFLLSIALLTAAYGYLRTTTTPRADAPPSPRVRLLAALVLLLSLGSIAVGTLVTGSGPHSGDAVAGRNGFDPEQISQAHADLVFLLLGLVIALSIIVSAREPRVLLTVVLAQGLVGFVQYFTGLPKIVVGAHLLGSCLVWTATLSVWWWASAPRTAVEGPEIPASAPLEGDLAVANAGATR